MIVLDTSGLLAAIDGSQRNHAASADVLRTADGPMLLSPFVLAELDYLLATRVSVAAELAFLDQVAGGAYRLEPMGPSDISRAVQVIARYRDLELGLADASIVVLAERHGTVNVLTLDQRRFRALDGPGGKPFRILPADG